jgi:hypothetical protein
MLFKIDENRLSINFKRGDIVNARGQIGVVVDVLESAETENICLYIRFIHNLGNARPYDMLELSPNRMLGVDQWRLATDEELELAINKRKAGLEREIGELLSITQRSNGNDS